MNTHKSTLSFLTSSAFALAIGMVSPALAQTKLVIGQVSRTATNWPHFVAQSQGLFKAENLAIQTEYVGNVALIAQQVVGGSLDIGNTTFEIVVQAVESGAPIVLIGSTIIKYPYTMLSAKDVKTAADIKGKKVMLPVPKNDIANFFDSWLQANGVKSADVDKIYDGSSTNRYAALTTGAVSAAAVTSPLDFMGEAAGFQQADRFRILREGLWFRRHHLTQGLAGAQPVGGGGVSARRVEGDGLALRSLKQGSRDRPADARDQAG